MSDPHDLKRFVDAQLEAYPRAVSELRAGRKQSHWMWYIFPQIKGLGHSAMAERYAISSLEEAKAYLNHAVLGSRLRECTGLVNAVSNRSIEQIFGYPDHLKLHSSLTLFARAAGDKQIFLDALQKYFGSKLDGQTVEHL